MNTVSNPKCPLGIHWLARATIGATLLATLYACGGVDSQPPNQWVATWMAASQDYNEIFPGNLAPPPPPLSISNQTVRQTIHTSYGGNETRIKLSNLFGKQSVTFSSVHLARSTGSGGVDAATDRVVTFDGEASVTLAAGTEQWSDGVNLPIASQSDLSISLYVKNSVPVATSHTFGLQTNYLSSGNQTNAATMSDAESITSYYWLNEVDVSTTEKVKVVVAFGDSITDGYHSTVDVNHRWPNFFSDRVLAAASSVGKASVVDAGISGNRWLNDTTGPAGKARFSRDVLGVSGGTHVIILLGINDIGFGEFLPSQSVSSDQIIGAMTAAIAQAKSRNMKVFLGTLLPYEGAVFYDASGEAKRQSVNAFVRSAPGVDGIIDFDKLMQDPSRPAAMLAAYDSGDHLHPNDAGYQAMANAVSLNLLSN
ncbi:SGNH/GDSL hydrolase family protein [Burkholderia sp. BCC1977]|uniref:SGNH/GDSL hydrolase family protein n=1 Tax=Burkholderia sp. BCC1977 TaxID=2817440 RepID=UPI002ABE23D4|nr:SGNH/GDSL hydrolase family protein [Burkholderia sp. BCC1977]